MKRKMRVFIDLLFLGSVLLPQAISPRKAYADVGWTDTRGPGNGTANALA